MTDLGEPTKYLGLELKQDRNIKTFNITQTKFIDKVLQRFNMSDYKMHDTPMVTRGNEIKFKSDESKIIEAPSYRKYALPMWRHPTRFKLCNKCSQQKTTRTYRNRLDSCKKDILIQQSNERIRINLQRREK